MARMSVRQRSPEKNVSEALHMYMYTGSSLLTQFERKQKKKRYEEHEATLALVAACDALDRTGLN